MIAFLVIVILGLLAVLGLLAQARSAQESNAQFWQAAHARTSTERNQREAELLMQIANQKAIIESLEPDSAYFQKLRQYVGSMAPNGAAFVDILGVTYEVRLPKAAKKRAKK